jgi:hypothetical protein
MGLNSAKFAGVTSARHTVAFDCPAHFDEMRLTLNSASATVEDFTMRLDSVNGPSYDNLLYRHDMNGVQDLRAIGTEEIRFKAGDAIDIIWANTGTITYGVEVRYVT